MRAKGEDKDVFNSELIREKSRIGVARVYSASYVLLSLEGGRIFLLCVLVFHSWPQSQIQVQW